LNHLKFIFQKKSLLVFLSYVVFVMCFFVSRCYAQGGCTALTADEINKLVTNTGFSTEVKGLEIINNSIIVGENFRNYTLDENNKVEAAISTNNMQLFLYKYDIEDKRKKRDKKPVKELYYFDKQYKRVVYCDFNNNLLNKVSCQAASSNICKNFQCAKEFNQAMKEIEGKDGWFAGKNKRGGLFGNKNKMANSDVDFNDQIDSLNKTVGILDLDFRKAPVPVLDLFENNNRKKMVKDLDNPKIDESDQFDKIGELCDMTMMIMDEASNTCANKTRGSKKLPSGGVSPN